MKFGILDHIAAILVTSAVVCFFLRKIILARFGFSFSPFDFKFEDGRRLKKVIAEMADRRVAKQYKVVNVSYPLLLVLGITCFVIARL